MDSVGINESHDIYYDVVEISKQVADQIKQKASEEKTRHVWDEIAILLKISDLMKEACQEANKKIDNLYTNADYLEFAQGLKQFVKQSFCKDLKPKLEEIFGN